MVKITDTVLRDAHQSLLATRMRTEDMLPIAPLIDEIGYWSVEMWGGATFDSCLRFLKEDPWERITKLRKVMPNTHFQMLLRGQNIVGYRHYSDDIVEKFVERAHARGIDVFRIFDALNDIRNMQTCIKAAKKAGAVVEASISYTTSPVHSIKGFVEMGKKLEQMGANTIRVYTVHPARFAGVRRRLRRAVGLSLRAGGAEELPRSSREDRLARRRRARGTSAG